MSRQWRNAGPLVAKLASLMLNASKLTILHKKANEKLPKKPIIFKIKCKRKKLIKVATSRSSEMLTDPVRVDLALQYVVRPRRRQAL